MRKRVVCCDRAKAPTTRTPHFAYLAQRRAESEIQRLLDGREPLLLRQQLSALKIQETERRLMVTLGNVLFEYGKANLKPDTRRDLFQLVETLKQQPDRNLLIEAHSNSQGSASYNGDPSLRRGASRAGRLAQKRHRSRPYHDPCTGGYSEIHPVASNSTGPGRLQNRRVDVYLSEPGASVTERSG